nr:porin family protein [uncultured Mucilaginibacter sp.]
MKKLIILSALGLTLTAGLNTATAQSTRPRIGIKAGANYMTLGQLETGGATYDYDYRFGFQGGLMADLPLASQLSFMPQVLYTQKGGNVKGTIGSTTGELKTRLNYLDVPLLVGFKPSPDVTLFAGPQVAFLLSQSSDTYVNGAATSNTTSTDGLRKNAIGGHVGLGYNFNSNVSLIGNYVFDFDKAANDNSAQNRAKNSGFALSLGYSF